MKPNESRSPGGWPTDSELLQLWQSVVDPQGIGMAPAIAGEIAAYTSESPAVVLERMESGTAEFAALWDSAKVDPHNARTVGAFYEEQFVEAYELANWHAGRTNGVPPLNYARAAWLARRFGLKRALDFGSGIGTGSLCLAAAGCEVHSADIARRLLAFVGHRMEQRGLAPTLIDLSQGEKPRTDYYDLITCFDVLEHIPDQLSKLRELSSYLRTGGYLLVNLMDSSDDAERPMHISSTVDWLALVRRTNLVPDWTLFAFPGQVLVKSRVGRLRNLAGSCVDRLQGATGAELRKPR